MRWFALIACMSTMMGCALAHERPAPPALAVRPMDLNGDGYADLAVGSEGAAYVYLGGPDGIRDLPDVVLTGPADASTYFGRTVTCAGDVDGDGLSDLAIVDGGWSSGGFYPINSGIFVVPGAAGGVDETRGRWLDATGLHAAALFDVAGVGDLDGDGIDDLFVVRQGTDAIMRGALFAGAHNFFEGAPRGSLLAQFPEVGGGSWWASWVGDVDGDGHTDVGLVVDDALPGGAFLFSSRAPTVFTSMACVRCGLAIGPAGDVDGDGLADLVVLGRDSARRVRASGPSLGEVIDQHSVPPMHDTWRNPQSLASGGDLDGDGALDFVVGLAASVTDGTGSVDVFWRGQDPPRHLIEPTTSLGDAVLDMSGDLNRDGRSDLVIGTALQESVRVLTWSGVGSAPVVRQLSSPSAEHAHFGLSATTGR